MVFPLEHTKYFWNSFQTSLFRFLGLLILKSKDCNLLVTITFCLIKFRLLFYNTIICKSTFLVLQTFLLKYQLSVCFFFFLHSRFLLLSRLACCYLLVVMCRYKKTLVKNRFITVFFFIFSEFFRNTN